MITWPLVTETCCYRAMDTIMALWWQHSNHGPRCHHQLLTSLCSSLTSSLRFCLFSLWPHFSISSSLPFIQHSLAPLRRYCGLWVSGNHVKIVSRVLCPACAFWLQAGFFSPSMDCALCLAASRVMVQVSCISGAYVTSLVVILDLLLAMLPRVEP